MGLSAGRSPGMCGGEGILYVLLCLQSGLHKPKSLEPGSIEVDWLPAGAGNYIEWPERRILGIVLHNTEGSLEATISTFRNPAVERSAHYVIAKEGRIIQMVRDEDVAFHTKGTLQMLPEWLKALPSPVNSGYTFSRPNAYTVGIELVLHKEDPDGAYTDDQYLSLGALLRILVSRHNIVWNRRRVLSHAELQSDRRDPRGFVWSRIGL